MTVKDNPLGRYLKDRRARLDPESLGFPTTRRRTPGLRREEVAQRANISATWYMWLEQGRGGAPSADVIRRIAHALLLTDAEREHLFLLALGRPPEPSYKGEEGITPRLQRTLDALVSCPAVIKTVTWDIVAWNRAASLVVLDRKKLEPSRNNILRFIFLNDNAPSVRSDWEETARFAVATFRSGIARAGAADSAKDLIEELIQKSPEFVKIWEENDVLAHTEGVKKLYHPVAGLINMEYSSFVVDGRADLNMLIFNAATEEDRTRLKSLLDHPQNE
jgi:transcriptional regulator with XRE-family HTH domain